MQKQQTTGLRVAAQDIPTIVEQASGKVKGFSELLQELDRSITINGKSRSMYDNYSRHLGHLALHYNQFPLDLSAGEVTDYLYMLKKRDDVSETYFKFTVFAMRYVCRMRGIKYRQFNLPVIKHTRKLPEVLNGSQIKALFAGSRMLKHRLIIGLLYGCGLRVGELQQLKIPHADLERGMLHVHQGKGSKDRCIPMGKMLCRGIEAYLLTLNPEMAHNPEGYLFEGKGGAMISYATIESAVKKGAAKGKINKKVHPHMLRHSYATHLLEQGVNIMTIKELLGHKRIETTMIYLHVAKPSSSNIVSPLDTLYGQH